MPREREEAGHAVVAGLAVHEAAVVVVAERAMVLAVGGRPGGQELVEQGFPGTGMDGGRVGDDAVQVEDHGRHGRRRLPARSVERHERHGRAGRGLRFRERFRGATGVGRLVVVGPVGAVADHALTHTVQAARAVGGRRLGDIGISLAGGPPVDGSPSTALWTRGRGRARSMDRLAPSLLALSIEAPT